MVRDAGILRGAFGLGVLRTMRGSLKRFVALATICALGVTMICGLKVACIDLRASADRFFDEQDLFDLRVQSTLGITDDDVAALAALEGVETAEGGWVETCYTAVGSGSEKVDVKALSASGLNQPRLLEGHLPVTADQVAVTRRYLKESGKSIGDTLSFRGSSDDDEDAAKVFARKDYTICGVVLDPTDVNAGEGTMSFRASGSSQYAFFLLPAAVESEVYTVVYVKVAGSEAPLCYSDAYGDLVDEVKSRVEGIAAEREAARGEGLRADANSRVDDAEKDALDKLADGQRQIDENQEKLDSGAAQIADGRAQLDAQGADAERQMADAQAKIDAASSELASNEAQVADGLQQIADGLGCSVDGIPDVISQKRAQLDSAQEELTYNRGVIDGSAQMLSALMGDEWPAEAWSRLTSATTEQEARAAASDVNAALLPFTEKATSFIDQLMQIVDSEEFRQIAASYDDLPPELRQRIDAVLDLLPASVREAARQILAASANADQILAQLQSLRGQLSQLTGLADGMVQIVAGQARIDAGRAQLDEAEAAYARLDAARSQIAAGRAELDAGQSQLDAQRKNAQEQLDAACSQLDSGARELVDGRAQLEAARAEFARQRADALAAIADARDQIASIDDAAWYVQDRESLASYSSVESDAGSIEAIGTALPVVFFVVAVLISLTTMTRMVEEERGLIGLYKALGYGRGRILSKYVVYASAACLAGGVAGNILGFVVLPLILFTIFSTMYALPAFYLSFDVAYALVSVGLFAVGIVGATALTCRRELAEQPAMLMRPKAPKAGSRILLERIAPLWRRLSFLNKVTARNIFRYKRRFLMTVFGIAGCTALLVCGFGIRDSVVALSGKQYGQAGVTRYDLMLVTSAADLEDVAAELDADAQVTSFVPARVDSLTVEYGGSKESVTLVVVPDDADLADYVALADDSGAAVDLADSGVAITKNAEQVLHFSPGDTLHVQDATLHEADVEVGAVVMNYLGNTLYMTQSAYERAFGQKSGLNGLLVKLGGTDEQKIAFSEKVAADARTLSAVSTAKLTRDFSSAFTLINTVVYVVIVLAAALSFTVVFTLSNTNISERERELATIKVLGFRPREVHTYINKETLLLTGLGVVFGLPGGYLLARGLTWILRMPSLYFDTTVAWSSYAISAALAFVFTIAVSLLTNRSLDRVDMVGALKSAE